MSPMGERGNFIGGRWVMSSSCRSPLSSCETVVLVSFVTDLPPYTVQ